MKDVRSPGVTPEQWAEICALFGGKCAYCDKPSTGVDHIIPLSRGGLDEPGNVVPCCRYCNSSKGPRLLSEWHKCPSWLKGTA